MIAAVTISLLGSVSTASADPWKDESGHGRFGGKHWKHEGRGHGHGWGHHRRHFSYGYDRPRFHGGYRPSRGYGYYGRPRGYDFPY
ncbi:hypothetical protein [Methylorubrum extorquens]